MAPEYRWYNQSWDATIGLTINRIIVRPIVRSIVATVIKVRSLDSAVERDPRGRGTGSVCELSEFKRTLENPAKEYFDYTFVVPKHCYS